MEKWSSSHYDSKINLAKVDIKNGSMFQCSENISATLCNFIYTSIIGDDELESY